MANEIFGSAVAGGGTGLAATGGMVESVLSDLIVQAVYDATDLTAVMTRIPWEARGGLALDVTIDPAPGAFAAVAEGADVAANSAYTTSKFSMTLARKARRYQWSDLIGMDGGKIQLPEVANKLVQGISLTMTDALTALFPAVAGSVGSASLAMSVDAFYDACFALNSNAANGPYKMVLHPTQINEFRSGLRSESGAVQWHESTFETLRSKGPGYQGEFQGVEVYSTSGVTNAGGAYIGAIMADGAFAYTFGDPRQISGAVGTDNIYFINEIILVEKLRHALSSSTTLVGNIWTSVVEAQDALACRVLSTT